MKAKLLVMVSLSLACWVTAAEKMDFNQLPEPVKKTIEAAGDRPDVKEITVRNVDGKTVYDVEFERKYAPNPHVRIAADGTVLRDTQTVSAVDSLDGVAALDPSAVGSVRPKLSLGNLPAPAQRTVENAAASKKIASITSDSVDGRPAYRVEFSESGRNSLLYVAEDGTLLRPAEKPPALFVGTTFSDTPVTVQQTIRREVGDREIIKIEKEGGLKEAKSYKVELKDPQGVIELQIADNGQVISDSRKPRLQVTPK
jgi:hypothetical protein